MLEIYLKKKMDELKDASIHHTSLKILSEITSMKNYDETIYKTVQVFCLFRLIFVVAFYQYVFRQLRIIFLYKKIEIGLFTGGR